VGLHEYQAKILMGRYGLPVPEGEVVRTAQEAVTAYERMGKPKRLVVKAQIYSGARGKAGGVRLVENKEDLVDAVKAMIGSVLVTHQTGPEGLPVHQVWLEPAASIERELYLGAVIDRATRSIAFMASAEGGVDIEELAENHPERIIKFYADVFVGLQPYQVRDVAFQLGLSSSLMKQFTKVVLGLDRMVRDLDLSLVEINPLVVATGEQLICLDGKFNVDDNALYRQKELKEMHDPTQEDDRESHANQWDLSYIPLDGTIGCMVNGAGLAMATMDLIKLYGGEPANFLDVGGAATQERVREAFKIILSDASIKAVLVNIFGGIVRCDLIADGIILAMKEIDVSVPVVVRLEGNNAALGREKLSKSGLNLIAADNLDDAGHKAVQAAKEGGAS
jgi:succinyl-CoA synthetase beta subunit